MVLYMDMQRFCFVISTAICQLIPKEVLSRIRTRCKSTKLAPILFTNKKIFTFSTRENVHLFYRLKTINMKQ